MSELEGINLGELLSNIKPSIVTPRLSEVTGIANDKKAKRIANIIVKTMVDNYNNSDDAKIPKIIMHDNQAKTIKYFDIEPMLTGVWPSISLMLLQLSYGEQTVIIEAIYPKQLQLLAKSFATAFTKTDTSGSKPIELSADTETSKKLDSANAGIAMIISMLGSQGYKTPHPDKVNTELNNMNQLVEAAEKEMKFRESTKRAQDAMKHNDR